ncbi:site-specific integrase [Clostridium chrysemydis]|uniref:site-specific integrase n=1 Tax=Clostridium chrysemydis TaxID=2665504 RepID=UPI0018847DD7|nr:site-specific integrase [Clostridium chrysemydis]
MQGSIRKRGNTWYYSFDLGKVDGKRKRKEKGGFRTKSDAQKALRDALNDYENSGSLLVENNLTFSDYLDYWFDQHIKINCKYKTQQYYKGTIENHLKPELGSYKIKSLTPVRLQEFLNSKYLAGFSKSSLSHFSSLISSSLKMAVYPYKFIKDNPMQYVKIPKINNINTNSKNTKTITLDEFKKITNRFPFGSTFHVPLQIAFLTGLRAGEVCALRWTNIDFNNKTLTVDSTLIDKGQGIFELGTPKTNSSYRSISIGGTLLDILKKHREFQEKNKEKYSIYYFDSDFICTKENGHLVTTGSFKYLSRVINNELNIDFSFHYLRHTHATLLLEGGANIKDIQHRLGHSKLSTTMDTYSHVTKQLEYKTVSILENIIAVK